MLSLEAAANLNSFFLNRKLYSVKINILL